MLKLYQQETRYSCAPACLRMVLSAWGVEVEEAELRRSLIVLLWEQMPSSLSKLPERWALLLRVSTHLRPSMTLHA